ncbi:MAG TPA: hypothetical protein VMZ25_09755 [Terriglobales bacterium]|nr:hypothetical protein [Terriglobales bacterium]
MRSPRWFSCLLVSALLCSGSQAQSPRKRPSRKAATVAPKAAPKAAAKATAPLRTKIAEGRYELRAHAGAVLQSWEEPWTLYKTTTGFEVEELWKASKQGSPNSVLIDVLLTLAPGLYPTQVRIGSDLSPAQLNCSMTMAEFRCATQGREAAIPMSGAYNFFLPSPWLLSSIARRAPKRPGQPVDIKLVQMSGMNQQGPVLSVFKAEVAYVGEDVVEISGSKVPANIYEIRGQDVPAIIVWLSSEGVVLMMQDAAKPDQRMELVEFKKLAAF